jgi:hypothetical protein
MPRRPSGSSALAIDPPPGTAIVLHDRYGEIERSSLDADRWLGEHFGAADHAGWLPGIVPRGSLCRRAHRWPARETGGASPSTCCPAIRTPCCSRTSRELPSGRTRIVSASPCARPRSCVPHRYRGRGEHRMGALPQPARSPRPARAPRSQARRETAADAVATSFSESTQTARHRVRHSRIRPDRPRCRGVRTRARHQLMRHRPAA